MTDKVRLEQRGKTLVVTIQRPERRNCVDGETAGALEAAVTRFRDDEGLAVLVLTGAGGQAFCSGADLSDLAGLSERPGAWQSGPMGCTRLADVGKPTIAAIDGYCTAGGLELACWCDLRVASAGAQFGVLNRRWGVPLVDGGTQRLPRLVGLGNALYLIETGVLIDAMHALRMGLVQEVLTDGPALPRALALAEAMAAVPQRGLRNDRAAALAGCGLPLEAGLEKELEAHATTLGDPEIVQAIARFAAGDRPAPLRPAD
ncbi:MAG: enoyl-CoA hydratase/isomerase family protein [Deltaproteobacteria bacterium]|nr:enoyl-CoA hydratase/isomerase family protein [Deltaproteobacteria bacterium]